MLVNRFYAKRIFFLELGAVFMPVFYGWNYGRKLLIAAMKLKELRSLENFVFYYIMQTTFVSVQGFCQENGNG